MAQYDFGNLESPLSGTTLINTHLEPFRDALHSSHMGDSRPSYAVPGMMWIDNTNAIWNLNVFDGTDDILMGTIDPATNIFTPANTKTTWGGSTGGTATAYTLTPTPALTALAAGVFYDFLVSATNTNESPTLAVSGLTAKAIKANFGSGKQNIAKGVLKSGNVVRVLYDGTDWVLMSNVTPNRVGSDIASASAVNLNNNPGDYIAITGTATITSFVLDEGQQKTIKATGAFTLTNNSSIILPGGADITAADGDVFVVRGEASSVVRIVSYTRADGTAIKGAGGSTEIIATVTASADGTVTFSDVFDDSVYDGYTLECFDGFISANDRMILNFITASGTETTNYSGCCSFAGYNAETYTTTNQVNITRISGAGQELGGTGNQVFSLQATFGKMSGTKDKLITSVCNCLQGGIYYYGDFTAGFGWQGTDDVTGFVIDLVGANTITGKFVLRGILKE